jgi:hypothetical protein
MKPQRPFGLTIAILYTWLVMTIIPLLSVGIVFWLNSYRFNDENGGMGGINISNFSVAPLVITMFFALVIGFIGILTWMGKPNYMRYVFPAMVVIVAMVVFFGNVLPTLTTPPNIADGLDSSQNVSRSGLSAYTVMLLVCAVYVVWFCNRWSARAFFRGYYTDKDLNQLQAAGLLPQQEQ